jgi:RND family efflux transporter MFP subunit
LVAQSETLVYARANGYVRRWLVDIGDAVETGTLLAELETPELDQQLSQVRATLKQKQAIVVQAIANRDFFQVTAMRMDFLRARNLVSQQDDDQARAQAAVGDANVVAAKADVAATAADVRQLEQLVSFGRVTAPFAGTITQRLIDVGSLVNAGGGAAGQALFRLDATDPIRVFVEVPQTFAPSVRAGESAVVSVRQYPGRAFLGSVTRTAGALDPISRTLNTEIEVPNGSHALFPGMYAQVTLSVAVSHPVIRVPSSAVIEDSRGIHVAVVDDRGVVHLVAVRPGRDNGTAVELVEGLSGGERVIVSPPGNAADGMQIEPVLVPAPQQDAGRD